MWKTFCGILTDLDRQSRFVPGVSGAGRGDKYPDAAPSAEALVEVVYEDDYIVVAAKPQGMCVHPAHGVRGETLVEWLRRYYETKGDPKSHIAAISRLDQGTSGLILVVTDRAAHPSLHRQTVGRAIRREYQCLVWGRPLFEETRVNVPLMETITYGRRMVAYDGSDRQALGRVVHTAATSFRVLENFGDSALLSATLETGRMHQIRVHCQFMRHPIVGDKVYGLRRNRTDGLSYSYPANGLKVAPYDPPEDRRRSVEDSLLYQCLHAGRLQFRHPITHEPMEFHQFLPESFTRAAQTLAAGMVY